MMRIILLLLSTLLIIPGLGCSKKFKLKRSEFPIETVWSYPRKDTNASAHLNTDYSGNLDLLWESDISGGPIAPINIGAGRLIISGSKRRFRFIDLENGKNRGKINLPFNSQTGMIVIDSLGYYAVSPPENVLVCINLINRKKLWSVNLKDVSGTPIILDNRLYVGSADKKIYCLDRLLGKTIWSDSLMEKSTVGPSGNNDMILIPMDNGVIRAYNPDEGTLLFETDLRHPLMTKTVISDKIYQTDMEGHISALDKKSGKIIWTKNIGKAIWTSPAVSEKYIYFGDNYGTVWSLDNKTGEPEWSYNTDQVINASPIIVGNYLILATLGGEIVSLDKITGELNATRSVKKGIKYPAVSDGKKIIMVSNDGHVYCFGD